jgi:hypothetical protein
VARCGSLPFRPGVLRARHRSDFRAHYRLLGNLEEHDGEGIPWARLAAMFMVTNHPFSDRLSAMRQSNIHREMKNARADNTDGSIIFEQQT